MVTHPESKEVRVRSRELLTTCGMYSIYVYVSQRAASRTALEGILSGALSGLHPAYVRDMQSWFANVMETVLAFLARA